MNERKIKVLMVDDHVVARSGIRLMLSTAEDLEVVGEASSVAEALRAASEHYADVALVDINLPDGSGIDLIKPLRELNPRLAVLMLSMYSEEVYAVRAFKSGASGYLTKSHPVADMVAAVRRAAAGGKYVSPVLMEKLAGMLGGESAGTHEALTNRELDVMRRIAVGESLVSIAEALGLSPSTVTTYRSRVLDKMGMKSNAELSRYALENDLV
ncbi:MAG TPA: response regulator transcription factor [Rhodocyclaceae bacterium]|nr:response regulator transcription factor [Rhodocyclaceae bacterium]